MLRRFNRPSSSSVDPSVPPLAEAAGGVPAGAPSRACARPLERAFAAARSRIRAWIGGLGIRARLVMLVLGLAMPFVLYIAAMAWSQAQSEREDAMAGDGERSIPARYTHRLLASMVGSNREAVTRAFGVLRRAGAVEIRDQRIYVTDEVALEGLAEAER